MNNWNWQAGYMSKTDRVLATAPSWLVFILAAAGWLSLATIPITFYFGFKHSYQSSQLILFVLSFITTQRLFFSLFQAVIVYWAGFGIGMLFR